MPSFGYQLSGFHGELQLETDKPSLHRIRARSTAKVLYGTKPSRANARLDQVLFTVLERLSASSTALPVGILVSDTG